MSSRKESTFYFLYFPAESLFCGALAYCHGFFRFLSTSALLVFSFFYRSESLASCKTHGSSWLEEGKGAYCLVFRDSVYAFHGYSKEAKSTRSAHIPAIYGAVYDSPRIGLHASYSRQIEIPAYSNERAESTFERSEYYLRLGHPDLDQFNVSMGRYDTTFGLGVQRLSPFSPSDADDFWNATTKGLKFSFQPSHQTELELSLGQMSDSANTISSRLSRYLSLLDGTRMVASYSRDLELNQDSVGFGVLVFGEGSSTLFEWRKLISNNELNSQLFEFYQAFEILPYTVWGLSRYYSQNNVLIELGGNFSLIEDLYFFSMIRAERNEKLKDYILPTIYVGVSFGFSKNSEI